MKRVLVSWSSGKDSAWALHLARQSGFEVAGLLTTLNGAADRVAMHAVRRSLLEAQARSAGLELWTVDLPWPCSNEDYECRMAAACGRAVAARIEAVIFGDLYLRDIRDYRERMLSGTGLEPLFPLWQLPTAVLAREMIATGLRARITCVDTIALPAAFAGREFDGPLLCDLPAAVDPCGENGEFHTFAYAGPMFRDTIDVRMGEIRNEGRFVFADFDRVPDRERDRNGRGAGSR